MFSVLYLCVFNNHSKNMVLTLGGPTYFFIFFCNMKITLMSFGPHVLFLFFYYFENVCEC